MVSEPLLHQMKILVVDDDRMSVTLLEQLLQRSGYCHVMSVTDSRLAVETCISFDPESNCAFWLVGTRSLCFLAD